MSMFNSNSGYFTTTNDTLEVYRCEDDNWEIIYANPEYQSHYYGRLQFLNPEYGFLLCFDQEYNNIVLNTRDGGIEWIEVYKDTTTLFYDMIFVDRSTGYIICENGTVIKTNDYGASWEVINIIPDNPIYDISCPSPETCYIVGSNSMIFKTTDGFGSWTRQYIADTSDVELVHFFDSDTGYVFTDNNYLYYTENGGTSFIPSFIAEESIIIYPNPADEKIILDFSDHYTKYETTIHIINLYGQVLYTINYPHGIQRSLEINTVDLEQGYYYLKVLGKNSMEIVCKPLIIQRY